MFSSGHTNYLSVHRPDLQSGPNFLSSEKLFCYFVISYLTLKIPAILSAADSQTSRIKKEIINKRRIVFNAI